jgi:hypothetical protein
LYSFGAARDCVRNPVLIRGYPSYLLLDPEGRIIASDDTIPGPSLRVHKLERIRQLLLERD